MIEISKRFQFDAAHFMPHAPEGHPYRQMHGHSFEAVITILGEIDPATGWVMDFDEIDRMIEGVRVELDHRLLNDIEGLAIPTLEHLTGWLWDRLAGQIAGVTQITVSRPSIGQSCTLRAPA